ncbi:MAG: hypothetical protein U1E15_08070 [Hyphomicrobiales bacterium]
MTVACNRAIWGIIMQISGTSAQNAGAKPSPKEQAKAARQKKLSAALKANLKRRKDAAKDKDEGNGPA